MMPALVPILAAIAIAAADAAQANNAVDQATIEALARSYSFGVAETQLGGCAVTLKANSAVELGANCRARFPVLRDVTSWTPTGGASIALFGGTPLREIADFAPVQDGTGVYLRGGFEGDRNLYELRLRDE